jgi:putative spermidine/putrescine transport system permease protein
MMNRQSRYILYLFCAVVLIYLALPILIVIPTSFSEASYLQFPPKDLSWKWYLAIWQDQSWTSAILVSIEVAILVVVLSTIIGVLASYALVRGEFKGKNLLTSFILSPMIIPHMIISIAVYKMYADMRLIGSIWGLALAHTVIVTPFIILNTSSVLRGFDRNLERAAAILGANRVTTFMKVVLPLIKPGVLAGALLSFIISFDDLVISMFICGNKRTLPVRIWEDIRLELTPSLAAISSIIIIVSMVVLFSATLLQKKEKK